MNPIDLRLDEADDWRNEENTEKSTEAVEPKHADPKQALPGLFKDRPRSQADFLRTRIGFTRL